MPQSMQRAPWAFSSGSASGSWYSMKSCTRSSTGRLGPLTRWILRKPPISPIARQHLLRGLLLDLRLLAGSGAAIASALAGACGGHGRVLVLARLADACGLLVAVPHWIRRRLTGLDRTRAVAVPALAYDRRLAGLHSLPLRLLAQRALVVDRHDLHPRLAQVVPPVQDPRGDRRVRALAVLLHQRANRLEVLVLHLLELYELCVAARRECTIRVEHVRDAAAHAGREVAPRRAEHDHAAAGHVLAAVVADALDHRLDSGVAHREALAGEAAEERPAAGRAVQHGVADHDVLLGDVRRVLRRSHRQHSAGQSLPGVFVGVAVEHHRDAAHQPAAEALSAVAVRAHDDRVVGQPIRAVAASDLTRQQATHAAVLVLHAHIDLHLLAALERRRGGGDDLVVAMVVEHRVLRTHASARHLGRRVRSSGSCVAMPTGHVLRWQARIMMQPIVMSGAVEKPHSSAPSSAAITTSRPVFSWPSV